MKLIKILAALLAGSAVLLTAAGSVPASDRDFVKKAAQGGLAEIQLSQLALTKSSNQKVKDFAMRMVDEHTKAADELRSVAAKKDIAFPTDLIPDDGALMTRLTGLSGDQFDKAYMSAMVKAHETDIAAFQKEANSSSDADLKGFASATLPALREHLRMAKESAASLGAPVD
jgi:putative membrane protein